MKEFELEPGEEVIREARKHWFIFLAELLPFAIMAVAPFAIPNLLSLAPPLSPYKQFFSFASPIGRVTVGIWLLLTWTAAWSTFTKYFLNIWILTNQRIVEIKQRGYFNREVSSLFLTRVQDVTTEVIGVIPSFLEIGNIKVQTAGEDVDFIMHGISRPEIMRDLILKYVPGEDQVKPNPL